MRTTCEHGWDIIIWQYLLIVANIYNHNEMEVATDLFLCIVAYIWVQRITEKEKNVGRL